MNHSICGGISPSRVLPTKGQLDDESSDGEPWAPHASARQTPDRSARNWRRCESISYSSDIGRSATRRASGVRGEWKWRGFRCTDAGERSSGHAHVGRRIVFSAVLFGSAVAAVLRAGRCGRGRGRHHRGHRRCVLLGYQTTGSRRCVRVVLPPDATAGGTSRCIATWSPMAAAGC